MSVPTAGKIGSKAPGAFEVVFLFEDASDHRRDFTHLHMLEAKLPMETLFRRFRLGRREPVAGGNRENPVFFGRGVARERFIEGADRVAGGAGVPRVGRAEEPSEQVVQAPVLSRQANRQER